MDWVAKLEVLYRAGDVKRLHVVRTLRPYTVAEHVYGAQCIAVELCHLNGVSPLKVLTALLYHDAAEVETGDVPANVKRNYDAVAAVYQSLEDEFNDLHDISAPVLGAMEKAIVKAADRLDCAWRCLVERQMGNHTPMLDKVLVRLLEYLREQRFVVGVERITDYIQEAWSNV